VHVPLRDAFTGAVLRPEGTGEERHLRVGVTLAVFPLALLEAA
jgi:hypothetical protein